MLNCKIGIVSFSYDDPSCFIVLGLIKHNNKSDINKLYNIHKSLKYLNPFIVKILSGDIIIENMTEILSYFSHFNIKINLELKNKDKKAYKFRKPELYDISCKCSLFNNKIIQPKLYLETKYKQDNKVFILFPLEDVILRGKILENTKDSFLDANTFFITLGNRSKLNIRNTSELNKRYLLTLGINSELIYSSNIVVEFPDIILELLEYINLFLQKGKFSMIFLLVKNDGIELLKHSKTLKSLGLISKDLKITFICE